MVTETSDQIVAAWRVEKELIGQLAAVPGKRGIFGRPHAEPPCLEILW